MLFKEKFQIFDANQNDLIMKKKQKKCKCSYCSDSFDRQDAEHGIGPKDPLDPKGKFRRCWCPRNLQVCGEFYENDCYYWSEDGHTSGH